MGLQVLLSGVDVIDPEAKDMMTLPGTNMVTWMALAFWKTIFLCKTGGSTSMLVPGRLLYYSVDPSYHYIGNQGFVRSMVLVFETTSWLTGCPG